MNNIQSPSPTQCADGSACEDQVRDYAYHLYEQSNRVPGRDVENWLEAAACLRARIPAHESGSRLHRLVGELGRVGATAGAPLASAPAPLVPALPSVSRSAARSRG